MAQPGHEQAPRVGATGAWRTLRPSDIPAVVSIAESLHPDFPERPEIFAEKSALFPEGCFALERQGAVCGYGFSHPWSLHDIPPLDAFLGGLPAAPDCLHLHDVAILEAARGAGAAAAVEALMTDAARRRGLRAIALVSIYGSDRLWRRLGYAPRQNARLREKLSGYGDTALYMVKYL
ncbi:GNAT family N-acetyltransferase [Methylocystis echinoides]|uniref:GNAT family N-acetyltransferase n=1 Tax=Methylocystis echinoides TaxID=29468 RepID=UPI0024933AE6|nr:GNAT family N-acetyltransferase [Methylocystis echinoides]